MIIKSYYNDYGNITLISNMEPHFIPKELIEIFGSLEKIYELPVFEINNDKFVMSYYPDFVKHDELSHPIMRAVDKFNRFIIIFKVKFIMENETRKMTEVLFQRYTDKSQWNTATCPGGHEFMFDYRLKYDFIKKVVDTGKVEHIESDRFGLGDYVLG